MIQSLLSLSLLKSISLDWMIIPVSSTMYIKQHSSLTLLYRQVRVGTTSTSPSCATVVRNLNSWYRSLFLFLNTSAKQFSYGIRSEEHTSELQSRFDLVCRLLLEKKNIYIFIHN